MMALLKRVLLTATHMAGLTMLVIAWGHDDAPVLIVPGLFALVAGVLYGIGLFGIIITLIKERETP